MSGQKHILFISSWYPHRNDATHGIFNRYFAQAVSLYNKVSVLHVCSDEHQDTEFEIEENEENNINTVLVYYKKIRSAIPLFSSWKKFSRRNEAFRLGYERLLHISGRPDLIHLNVVMPAGISVLELSKTYELPYVVNENWSGYCEEDGNYKGFFQNYFTRKVIASAKAIMPTSRFLMRAMQAHGLKGNYVIVPNVVDTRRFVPRQKKSQPGAPRFVHVSSLTDREKNVSGLIRAFSNAVAERPGMELHIVGDGEDKKALEQLAKGLDKTGGIKFKGRLLGQELVDEINDADCLVMFSHFETFCLVIIEAFACGKPVITSNAGAIKDYMRPELGIMVEKGSEAQLKKAFLNFEKTRESYDPSFIRDFAVTNYSYEKVGESLDKIYSEVTRRGENS